MSGFEAVGIVLATLPLCISALEHYRVAAGALDTFWEIRREYRNWKREFEYCQIAFEQNLEQCLLPLVVDEDELLRLIASPSDPLWRDEKLEAGLKARLPKSYNQFIERIQQIESIVNELKDELGITNDSFQTKIFEPKKTWREKLTQFLDTAFNKPNIEFQAQRFKMTLGRAKQVKLFEEFTDCNNKLRSLLEAGDRIAALRSNRKVLKDSSIMEELGKFCSYANSLYQVLSQAWRCDCRASHYANLRLQHRTIALTDFQITFFSARIIGARPWSWQETNIKLIEESVQEKHREWSATLVKRGSNNERSTSNSQTLPLGPSQAIGLNAVVSMQKATHSSISLSKKPIIKRRVTFSGEIEPLSQPIPVGLVPIEDLCQAIATGQPGYLGDDNCNFSFHSLKPNIRTAEIPDVISLERLLSKENSSPLSRLERYSIAVTLASSQVQLHTTAWIGSFWSKKDIIFLKSGTNPAQVCLDRVYISRDFSTPPYLGLNLRGNSDSSVRNLGIMLLELCFGRTLEDYKMEKGYPELDAHEDFLGLAAAILWLQRASEEAGPEFAEAVSWCLCSLPGSGDADGKLGRWRQEFLVMVLEPLQYCLETLKTTRRREEVTDQDL